MTSSVGNQNSIKSRSTGGLDHIIVENSDTAQIDPCGVNKSEEMKSWWKWIIVFTSFFTQFIEGITLTFGVFLVDISKEFKSSGKGAAAWVASIMVGQYHIVGPLGSVLVNKFGARKVSIVGSLIGAAGFALSYFAKSVYILYVTVGLISGLGLSLLYLPAMVSVPQYFQKKRALAIGISVCGAGVGTLFFEYITSVMLPKFGWRETMLITSGIILTSIPVSFFYDDQQTINNSEANYNAFKDTNSIEMEKSQDSKDLKLQPTENNVVSAADDKNILSEELSKENRKIFNLSLLKDRVFLLFAMCDIFMGLGYSIPYLYLPEIEQSMSGESKSTILGIIGITNIAARALTGLVGDYKWFNRHIAYSSTLLFCGLLTIGSPWLPTLLTLRIYAAVYGTLLGSYMTLKSVNLVDILGLDKLTDAYGMLLLFQAMGFIVGPPIVGVLHDKLGSYKPGFIFAGVVIVLGGILLFFIPIVQRSVQRKLQKSTSSKLRLHTNFQ